MINELGVKNLATTLRIADTSNMHSLTGVLYSDGVIYKSPKYEFQMLSRIGGGDAFASGVIAKMLEKGIKDKCDIVEFGVAAAVLKHAQIGDVSLAREEEILNLINNKTLGSVNR